MKLVTIKGEIAWNSTHDRTSLHVKKSLNYSSMRD